jgi:branched-chain amino acid aminotransferase
VSVFDHGLLVGDGVFESLRVYGGHPFAWRRHLDRLEASAAAMDLGVPNRAVVREAAEAVLAADGLSEARVRITVTGGIAPLGSARGEAPPTVVVAATAVAVVPWSRNERAATAGVKTTSYADNVRALAFARARGASEAIFANTRDHLCEATGSNIFLVEAGVVHTPELASGCLPGVTRALVLELCRELAIEAREATIAMPALGAADEAFLTSSTREVQGIASIVGGRTFVPAPGPVTARLAGAFTDLVAHDLDP